MSKYRTHTCNELRKEDVDKKVFPETGKIVVFHNCIEDTNKPHPDSLHGACPVLKGEKWAFNLWFRERSRSI